MYLKILVNLRQTCPSANKLGEYLRSFPVSAVWTQLDTVLEIGKFNNNETKRYRFVVLRGKQVSNHQENSPEKRLYKSCKVQVNNPTNQAEGETQKTVKIWLGCLTNNKDKQHQTMKRHRLIYTRGRC